MHTESRDSTVTRTLAETAYDRLYRDILVGARPPGERLRLEMLKSIYGIGPTPLREALQRIAQDGLVVSEGNRGFRVAPLDPVEFLDLNLARTVIEREALRLALERGDDAWEAGVVAARHIMAKEDAALARAREVPDSWERANSGFHAALVAACGSRTLLRLRAGLHDHCARYRRASVGRQRHARNLGAEHAAIAAAALARDLDRVLRLTEAHFARTAADLQAPGAGGGPGRAGG